MKYFITTFGCQMNVHESEKLAGVLEARGILSCDKIEDADIIIFNTCAIREGAQDRAVGNVGALKKLKKENPDKIIAICGCMTQQKEVSEKLYKTFPFVDIIFGTKNLNKFSDFIDEIIKNREIVKKSLKKSKKERILEISDEDLVLENMPIHRTSGNNNWVNIIYGCNNFCSYCIVPYVRGRERSRKKEDILNEIKTIIENKKEEKQKITLLGQNVNSYGKDIYENYGFKELLHDICQIEGDFELTFMTSHPKDITKEVIETIANEKKILKELHLPVQSGSNAILKAMNRRYTVENYLEKVDYLRKLIPEIRLTTDIIVGFPGETEEDFNLTCELVKKVKYAGIFAFMYSPRPNTPAAKMENQVPDSVKNYRVNYLLNLQKQFNR
ncbi:MAG: tRNA (N6-isopentenyl adenosine(37)-C2)-methylthiotransferase MiaB [Firmicutes bacterium]|nr:tRNA (N6-isopentenyl adenosine(37)-C2)-methylthiotransferase MiaB [Bacillota bacterium]